MLLASGGSSVVTINRAPVLTLWGAVVAYTTGKASDWQVRGEATGHRPASRTHRLASDRPVCCGGLDGGVWMPASVCV